MFKVTVKAAAKARKVRNYYQLGLLLSPNHKREVKFEMMARRLWEGTHEPTLTTLGLVSDALDCELSDLVMREGKRAQNPKPPKSAVRKTAAGKSAKSGRTR